MADIIVRPFTDRSFNIDYKFNVDGSFEIRVHDETDYDKTFYGERGNDLIIVAQGALAWIDSLQTWDKIYKGLMTCYQYKLDLEHGETVFVTRGEQMDQIIVCHSSDGFSFEYPQNSSDLYSILRDYGSVDEWQKIAYVS